MESKKQQRGLGKEHDRLMANVSRELGEKVRKEADKRGMSISNFLSSVIKTYFNVETEKL